MLLDFLKMPRSYFQKTLSLKCIVVLLNRISATAVQSGGCGGTGLQVLQKLQNRAARIVTNSSYDSSASALIKSLNWPTVADMIKTETACMVYKSINAVAPDYLSEMFVKNSTCSRKNLRNTATDLQVPLMRTSNGQRAFSYRGVGVWNLLGCDVKQASLLKAFKGALKNSLFIYLFNHLFIIVIKLGFYFVFIFNIIRNVLCTAP